MGTVTTLPRGRALTRVDLDGMPDDGRRYELIDGSMVVTPAPPRRHQRVVGELYLLLRGTCPPDLEVFLAPFDVVLADDTVMQPDLLVARRSGSTERDSPPRRCWRSRNSKAARTSNGRTFAATRSIRRPRRTPSRSPPSHCWADGHPVGRQRGRVQAEDTCHDKLTQSGYARREPVLGSSLGGPGRGKWRMDGFGNTSKQVSV